VVTDADPIADPIADRIADPVAAVKREIRSRVLAARARLDQETAATAAEQIADNVVAPIGEQGVQVLCAYVSMPTEPGTEVLIDQLHRAGVTVLLPVLLDDLDLDWAAYRPGQWRRGRFGLVEPSAPPLGVDAIRTAELVLCPGVAGTPAGQRLGRGGGSYDRALARSLPSTARWLLLYDAEVVDDLPTAPHDQPVDAIVTPTSLVHVSARRRF